MDHVRKGCLTRRREDIAADGSRIEGSHKHLNSIQRAQSSGLAMMLALLADTILRRNIRIVFRPRPRIPGPQGFDLTTGGSHQIALCSAINELWNALVVREQKRGVPTTHTLRPTLPVIDSGEKFGLQGFEITENTFDDPANGLYYIKDEDIDAPDESLVTRAIDELRFTAPTLPDRPTHGQRDVSPTSDAASESLAAAPVVDLTTTCELVPAPSSESATGLGQVLKLEEHGLDQCSASVPHPPPPRNTTPTPPVEIIDIDELPDTISPRITMPSEFGAQTAGNSDIVSIDLVDKYRSDTVPTSIPGVQATAATCIPARPTSGATSNTDRGPAAPNPRLGDVIPRPATPSTSKRRHDDGTMAAREGSKARKVAKVRVFLPRSFESSTDLYQCAPASCSSPHLGPLRAQSTTSSHIAR